ncbi:MAG: DDE-type integrase/transposase/recombinase, partial [Synechococcales cyanobacterium H12SWP_bin.12]|nr:DDE-type integrase/transposase/recombinase [Synechococcales cyanobacterium H12SWP_bin.12]
KDLFLAIFQTIDNRKAQMKISLNNLYPGDGIETFKYLYKKFGISGPKQSEAHFNLFDIRQMDGETPQDFAERISNINATLADQVPEPILVNLFLKGLWDPGLKTFILQNGQPNDLDEAASSCDSYETRERIINDGPAHYRAFVAQGQKGGQKGKGKGKGFGQPAAGFKGKGGRGGYGRGGNGRAYGGRGAQSCDLCGLNTHFWRSCWSLLPSLRPDWMDANAHREHDAWCVQCLNRSTPEKRRMFLEYRREKNEPELEGVNIGINGNIAEVAQQAAAQEFPGLVARTHIQPSVGGTFASATETITLGFAVFAHICHEAKRGLYYFLTGPLMQFALCAIAMVSCMGGVGLFASMMFVQFGQANGLMVSQFAVSPSSFRSIIPVVATPELPFLPSQAIPDDTVFPAFPATLNSSVSIHYDSCAGMWMFPTTHNLVKADDKSIRAEVSSCFGNRSPSKMSGIFRVGIRHNRKEYLFDVHGLHVPALPQPLASATSFMKSDNVSLILSKNFPHIVLPDGTKVPLDTKDDVTLLHDVFFPSVSSEPNAIPPARRSRWSAFNAAITSKPKGSVETFKRWTQRCAGLAPAALSHLSSNSVGCDCPSEVPADCKNLTWYASGMAGKMRAFSHKNNTKRATRFREVVQFDYLEFTIKGVKFHSLNFVDTKTTHAKCYVTKSRADADMLVLSYVNDTDPFVVGTTTFECQRDRAKEFLSKALQKKADLSGIVLVSSVPYQHQMNGAVERFNQTLQRMVITLLDDSKLPMEYVKYVIRQAEWIYNRVPVADLEWKSRYELVSHRKPDMRTLYRIGSLARRLKPIEKRTHKFDTRVEDCVNLGWNGAGWDLLRLSDGQVLQDVDVVMYEHEMPFHARSVGG